jgi:hypothetical protein
LLAGGSKKMKKQTVLIFILVFMLFSFVANGFAEENLEKVVSDSSTQNDLIELQKKAESGDIEAQYKLGQKYYRGLGVNVDNHQAFYWFTKAAEQNHIEAQHYLGAMYYSGCGTPQDYQKAFKWYKKAAEQGSIGSQFTLGLMYAEGKGTRQDSHKARMWFTKAGEQGDAELQYVIGFYFFYGTYTSLPRDYKQAFKWFEKSAERGYARAQYMLGVMYGCGLEIDKDWNKAFYWFTKAAVQGDADAQSSLGGMYYGEWDIPCDIPQDYHQAFKWHKKAAEQGNLYSQYWLGVMYWRGRGVPQDYREALKWSEKAAERGYRPAQYNVGHIYYYGLGVEKDYQQAFKWFTKSAERGDTEAQFMLGEMYYYGRGVAQDYQQAFKWVTKSAEQGHARSQLNAGIMYYNGEGVPENYIKAYKWLILAAAQGDSEARDLMNMYKSVMSSYQISEAQRLASEFEVKRTSQTDSEERLNRHELKGTGTGFFITEDGYLLTAYHVVEEASSIEVILVNKKYIAQFIEGDPINDVALLKVQGNFTALPIIASSQINIGDEISTMGFPNVHLQGLNPKLTKGHISSLTGIQDDPRCFQISAAVQPGNSGGALVDKQGNVVGLLVARLGDIETLELTGTLPQNVNYALKSSYILAFLESNSEAINNIKQTYLGNEEILSTEDPINKLRESTVMIFVY